MNLLTAGLLAQMVLTPAQEEVIRPFFRTEELVVTKLTEYSPAGQVFSWDQKLARVRVTLRYARQISTAGKNQQLHIQIHHDSHSQAVQQNFVCRAKELRHELSHPEFGRFVACLRLHEPNGQNPLKLMFATVYPLAGNRLPHVSLESFAPAAELPKLIRSLERYRGAQ